jgi:hypothetical protein
MRIHGIGTLAAGVAAIGAIGVWPGCSATKPTELVPAVQTQVQVPRNLAAISIQALANGSQVFCRTYLVAQGNVELPATLGFVQGVSPETVVTITVRGYDSLGANSNSFNACSPDDPLPLLGDAGSQGAPRVLRRSVQTYTPNHELFVPLPLSYSCYDTNCSSAGVNGTCKGAQCVDGTADGGLVEFNPDLAYGTADPCFRPTECFEDEVPAVLVDPENCIYKFLEPTPPESGLNVKVFYGDFMQSSPEVAPIPASATHPVFLTGGEVEILSQDAVEGFTVLGHQQFELAPGLCKLAQQAKTPPAGVPAYRAITDVHVASACAPKLPLLPFCASEAKTFETTNLGNGASSEDGSCNVPRKLLPAPTALYLAMDDTQYMQGNSLTPTCSASDGGVPEAGMTDGGVSEAGSEAGPAEGGATDGGILSLPAFGTNGQATFLSLFLTNPVFARTYLAFNFLDHDKGLCAGSPYPTPVPDFGLAGTVAPTVQSKLTAWCPPAGDSFANPLPLQLQSAMSAATGAIEHIVSSVNGQGSSYNTQAVMFFVNRAPGATNDAECAPPTGVADVPTEIVNEATTAFTQNAQSPVKTYFVVLNDANGDAQSTVIPAYQQIAQRAPLGAITVVDATNSNVSLGDFAKVMEPMTTCLYNVPDVPAGSPAIDWSQGQLKFTNPVALPGQGDTIVPASDWSIDSTGKRIQVKGQSCANLQNLIVQVAEYSILQSGGSLSQIPSQINWLEVPVTLTPQCGGSDGGMGGD